MNIKNLELYTDAWNEHDIEKIMHFMTEDCLFMTGGGAQRYGARFEGRAAVRERFENVWKEFPDVRFANTRHFLDGDRGCSEWTFVATNSDGVLLEIDGCDLLTFKGEKIAIKNTFLKNRK